MELNRQNNAFVRSTVGVHTCRKYHEHGAAKVTFIYNTDHPLGFGVSFKVGEYGQPLHKVTTWFSRDQFTDWLAEAVPGSQLTLGECGARVRKSMPQALVLKFFGITLCDGVTEVVPMIIVSREFVQGFLANTYTIKPRKNADGDTALQIDACIEQILNAGK